MKTQLTSFDIFCTVKELNRFGPAYLEKIYTAGDGGTIFRFSGSRDFELQVSGSFVSVPVTEKTAHPDSFTMELRKHIQGRRIEGISQVGFDRIVRIGLGEYALYLEVFAEGNIVLVKEDKILAAKHYQKYGQREIGRGEEYRPPPAKLSPLHLDETAFSEFCKKAKYDVRRNLVSQLWLGGIAEEVLLRSGVEGSVEVRALSCEQRNAILNALQEILDKTENPEPQIVYADGKPVDVVPISLRIYDNFQKKTFGTFIEATGAYLAEIENLREIQKFEAEKAEKIEKARRKLEIQMQELRNAEAEYEKWQTIGNFIYEHYSEIDAVLGGSANAGFVVAQDERTVKCRAGEIDFQLDKKLTVNQNAQNAFARAARCRKKVGKLRELIKNTETRIEALERMEFVQKEKPIIPAFVKRKTFWFETYRWFISSDGFIVVSGYDAESNDRVVKKYLKEKDRYVHANIHGSPSTVIKSGGKEIPETTIREACVFTVSYSRAWSQSAGNLDAYWVKPEQVSKTPQSGEFVPRGAWIIRGTKNFVPDLKPELAIGWIEYEGEKLLMCGPETAFRKKTEDYILLVPGDEEKEIVAKRLAEFFGVKIETVQKLLPAGKTKIIKRVGEKVQ
ncbi:MAG: ribosome rescue protein RqcH [Thermoplasmata archaeon]|nr:ribosome rescue protein RqcH [Thermoplasmata archaeon]